jgi:hypothetical protein
VADKRQHRSAKRGDDLASSSSASVQKRTVDVVDDLPIAIPLTVAELDAIGSYLGPLLDALLHASRCNMIETSESAASSNAERD